MTISGIITPVFTLHLSGILGPGGARIIQSVDGSPPSEETAEAADALQTKNIYDFIPPEAHSECDAFLAAAEKTKAQARLHFFPVRQDGTPDRRSTTEDLFISQPTASRRDPRLTLHAYENPDLTPLPVSTALRKLHDMKGALQMVLIPELTEEQRQKIIKSVQKGRADVSAILKGETVSPQSDRGYFSLKILLGFLHSKCASMYPEIVFAPLTLAEDFPDEVLGEEETIKSILMNLYTNAGKYAEPAEPILVTVEYAKDGQGSLELKIFFSNIVRNRMEPHQVGKLFEMHNRGVYTPDLFGSDQRITPGPERTASATSAGGAASAGPEGEGIGLYDALAKARSLMGDLTAQVDDKEPQTITFTFICRLQEDTRRKGLEALVEPATSAQATALSLAESPSPVVPQERGFKKCSPKQIKSCEDIRVWIFEDNVISSSLLEQALKKAKIKKENITIIESGEKAVIFLTQDPARTLPCDLIFMDNDLKTGPLGIEIARQIFAMERGLGTPPIPLYLTSSDAALDCTVICGNIGKQFTLPLVKRILSTHFTEPSALAAGGAAAAAAEAV